MPVTEYHTVNGRIIGETTGGVQTDYIRDALGSVTATADSSANVVNTYVYKPYGALLARTTCRAPHSANGLQCVDGSTAVQAELSRMGGDGTDVHTAEIHWNCVTYGDPKAALWADYQGKIALEGTTSECHNFGGTRKAPCPGCSILP
jgi:hypothetical protein